MTRKADLAADVKRLRAAIERAALDAESLAADLDAVLAGLPKSASKATRSHITLLAERAHASAAGLGGELRQPKPDAKFAAGFATLAKWTAGAVGLGLTAGFFQPIGDNIRVLLLERVAVREPLLMVQAL